LTKEALAKCLENLAAVDLPDIWKPKADAFYKVDALPYLGTGKLDLKGIKTRALELTQ
jgi:acyl-[acyl-carrier-protein]-phospholipid O-acyltransferase/long-chain-fatty-acid--[acyl-carrier-protein] ligase